MEEIAFASRLRRRPAGRTATPCRSSDSPTAVKKTSAPSCLASHVSTSDDGTGRRSSETTLVSRIITRVDGRSEESPASVRAAAHRYQRRRQGRRGAGLPPPDPSAARIRPPPAEGCPGPSSSIERPRSAARIRSRRFRSSSRFRMVILATVKLPTSSDCSGIIGDIAINW